MFVKKGECHLLVELSNVTKGFKNRLVLDHIDLTIQKGEVIGLLGPNGAGKTTTIRSIMNLTPIDDGEIRLFGKQIKGRNQKIKQRMGMVPQEIVIFEDLSVRENLHFFGKMYGLKGDNLIKRIDETLAFIGLTDRQKLRPKTFSGGMKRRLNIGCAIIHEPELLIMDEPTVGIDPQSRNHILESVQELTRRGMTIIYTSHYMEEVQTLCDRIIIMDNGKVITEGSSQTLMGSLTQEEQVYLEVEHESPELIKGLLDLPGVKTCHSLNGKIEMIIEPDTTKLAAIIDYSKSAEITAAYKKQPNLEDVFLTLTGKSLRDGEE